MVIAHLSTTLEKRDLLADFVTSQSCTVALSFDDVDTIVGVASLKDRWQGPLGVWLRIGPDYSASIAARDVKTLSWIVELTDVIIHGGHDVKHHSAIVQALLGDDEVNLKNQVASIRHAFNRPAPPRALKIWSWNGSELAHGDEVLHRVSRLDLNVGELESFE